MIHVRNERARLITLINKASIIPPSSSDEPRHQKLPFYLSIFSVCFAQQKVSIFLWKKRVSLSVMWDSFRLITAFLDNPISECISMRIWMVIPKLHFIPFCLNVSLQSGKVVTANRITFSVSATSTRNADNHCYELCIGWYNAAIIAIFLICWMYWNFDAFDIGIIRWNVVENTHKQLMFFIRNPAHGFHFYQLKSDTVCKMNNRI